MGKLSTVGGGIGLGGLFFGLLFGGTKTPDAPPASAPKDQVAQTAPAPAKTNETTAPLSIEQQREIAHQERQAAIKKAAALDKELARIKQEQANAKGKKLAELQKKMDKLTAQKNALDASAQGLRAEADEELNGKPQGTFWNGLKVKIFSQPQAPSTNKVETATNAPATLNAPALDEAVKKAEGYAQDAKLSAEDARISEKNANRSGIDAELSADDAKFYAGKASTSEINAANSAKDAGVYANNAATSAEQAAANARVVQPTYAPQPPVTIYSPPQPPVVYSNMGYSLDGGRIELIPGGYYVMGNQCFNYDRGAFLEVDFNLFGGRAHHVREGSFGFDRHSHGHDRQANNPTVINNNTTTTTTIVNGEHTGGNGMGHNWQHADTGANPTTRETRHTQTTAPAPRNVDTHHAAAPAPAPRVNDHHQATAPLPTPPRSTTPAHTRTDGNGNPGNSHFRGQQGGGKVPTR